MQMKYIHFQQVTKVCKQKTKMSAAQNIMYQYFPKVEKILHPHRIAFLRMFYAIFLSLLVSFFATQIVSIAVVLWTAAIDCYILAYCYYSNSYY